MILSDGDILGYENTNLIDPFYKDKVQPASYDVMLHQQIRVFKHGVLYIDPFEKQDLTNLVNVEDLSFVLRPGEFVLGATFEKITLPNYLAARVEGKSSLGRLGLAIHSTAGWIDPGYSGTITLEISNIGPLPIVLYSFMPIAQIAFMQMSNAAKKPYGHPDRDSKYQGDIGPTESRYKKGL